MLDDEDNDLEELLAAAMSGPCTRYRRDGTPYPATPEGVMEWSRDFQDRKVKVVAQEMVNGYWVSTVWIGLDHNFDAQGPPLIFETMVFTDRGCGSSEDYCERYATENDAILGHLRAVDEYKGKPWE